MNEFKPLGSQDLNDLVDFRTRIGMCLNKVSFRMCRQISIEGIILKNLPKYYVISFADHDKIRFLLK